MNRLKFPIRHVLVCEDDAALQAAIAKHFAEAFEPQGIVQFSYVPGGLAAVGVMSWTPIQLILLDHDMPNGNGSDLLSWMKVNKVTVPVITFSGLPANNTTMMRAGANHEFYKYDVIAGKADALIKQLLGM